MHYLKAYLIDNGMTERWILAEGDQNTLLQQKDKIEQLLGNDPREQDASVLLAQIGVDVDPLGDIDAMDGVFVTAERPYVMVDHTREYEGF